MKHFVVSVKWNHRKWGPQHQTLRPTGGSNMPLAIKRALNAWLNGLDRKERFDVSKGLSLTVVPCAVVNKEEQNEIDKRTNS
jgi:hypothetical protein